MKVVARGSPLKRITEPVVKFVPLSVNVNGASPTVLVLGMIVLNVGAGLFIVKNNGADSPPVGLLGSKTVTAKVPAVAISAALIEVVSCVALTKAVARSVPLTRITKSILKLKPSTVSVNPALPAIAVEGVKLFRLGAAVVGELLSGLEEKS